MTEHAPPSFAQHRDEQIQRWARLTPLERLRMLEDMKEFVQKWLGAARPGVVGDGEKDIDGHQPK